MAGVAEALPLGDTESRQEGVGEKEEETNKAMRVSKKIKDRLQSKMHAKSQS